MTELDLFQARRCPSMTGRVCPLGEKGLEVPLWLYELRPTQDLCNLPNMKIEPRSLSCEAIASGPQRPISQIFTRCFGKALSWHHLYESRSGFQMRGRCRMTASGHFANWALKVCLHPRSSRASTPAGRYRWAWALKEVQGRLW